MDSFLQRIINDSNIFGISLLRFSLSFYTDYKLVFVLVTMQWCLFSIWFDHYFLLIWYLWILFFNTLTAFSSPIFKSLVPWIILAIFPREKYFYREQVKCLAYELVLREGNMNSTCFYRLNLGLSFDFASRFLRELWTSHYFPNMPFH